MNERFNVLSRLMVGFSGQNLPADFEELAVKGLRSVVIYGENVESEGQLKSLVSELRGSLGPDAIIAIDEEGGDVTRVDYLVGSRFVGNGWLGHLNEPELTRRDGQMVGELLNHIGVNLNFAPVADVNTNPLNPVIGNRSFGSDQSSVARHVARFVEGHEGAGTGTTLKHFPGHGNVVSDSHLTLPKVPGGISELENHHLEPFESGISAGASAVMLAHLDLGDGEPTSLSSDVVQILRRKYGFDGLVITDALDMGAITDSMSIEQAAVNALLAGSDLACLGPRTTLDTITEFLRLWNEVPADVRQENQDAASRRLEAFVDGRSRTVSTVGPVPSYDIRFDIPESFGTSQVVRINSGTNPAVGEAPWFDGVNCEREIQPEFLAQELAATNSLIAITRGGELVWQALAQLKETEAKKLLLISTDAPPREFGCQLIVTFGSAQPQSLALSSALTRKESQIV